MENFCLTKGKGVHEEINQKFGINRHTLKGKVKFLSCVQLFASPWTVAYQASSVHGIFRARILEWGAISYFRGSSQPRDQTCVSRVSCINRQILYHQLHLKSLSFSKPISCLLVAGHMLGMSRNSFLHPASSVTALFPGFYLQKFLDILITSWPSSCSLPWNKKFNSFLKLFQTSCIRLFPLGRVRRVMGIGVLSFLFKDLS